MSESTVYYSGILKLKPNQKIIDDILLHINKLPDNAIYLGDKNMHVTLVHQSILKPFKKVIKQQMSAFPPPPNIILSTSVIRRIGPSSNNNERRESWAIFLKNQLEMRQYVNDIMKMIGGPVDPEPDRAFHISIANLTGNPGDSVR